MQQFQDGQAADIRADLIDADFNYRRRYHPDRMASLQADIRQRGIIQRVIIRPRDNGRFQLVVGNRRYRAFVAEFGREAPVKSEIRILSDLEATAMMAAENGEREDPSVIEDAELASRMLGVVKGDRDEAARRLGWERRKFDRRVALMNATQAVRDAYLEDRIGVGHVEILAALRKEVQDRVIQVILQQPATPSVEQLKAMAEQSLQNLETAIFDRTECAGCQFNTGNQRALFDQSFSGTRCTNRECFGQKTEAQLEARRIQMQETYQVVRIVRPGDNSTVIALRADGKRPVGAEQAAACRTCASFGACVSGVSDSLGKVYEDVCFDQACNDRKVNAWRHHLKAVEEAASAQQEASQVQAAAAAATPARPGAAGQGTQANAQRPASRPAPPPPDAAQIRNAINEYRESIWRAVFHRAALKLPVLESRQLLLALLAHRPGFLDHHKAIDAIHKVLGVEIPTVGARTRKLMETVQALDQAQVGAAFQHLAAHVSKDMPIEDVVGLLQALGVKLEDHWKVNETFFETLTKTELDAVCVEVGLADAAGKHYARLQNGSKKDFVKAMLKVEGFNYLGAIPRMMRWDFGV
ncbi:PRTRC system ParB family protein [Ramlibacter sp. AN1133]|uniref:PRTRC system ParB family protein n=1 Tax=Ramlibacter sp. AN1133 TaxID=3133429 RepID=UPI0030C4D302